MQQPGYGPPPGAYGAPPGGGAGGQTYQVVTIDTGCFSGTIEHQKIAEISNRMAASGYNLDKIFIDVRSMFGPFCPKRCGVLVFKKG